MQALCENECVFKYEILLNFNNCKLKIELLFKSQILNE